MMWLLAWLAWTVVFVWAWRRFMNFVDPQS